MLTKLKSFGLSIITNIYMVFFGITISTILQKIVQYNLFYQMILYQFILFIKNYVLMFIINFGLKNKKNIVENNNLIEAYYGEFCMNVFQATFVEVLTLMIVHKFYFTFPIINFNILYEFIWFIPLSFIFEIIFDFFHYWTHRIAHMNITLYKYLHKKHHKFVHPSPITTFYQEPLDLILTNSLPIIFTLLITPQLTYFQYILILLYKTYIEISGHTCKKLYPTSSFPQFMYLPKYLNIELYAEDHDNHHSKNNCNYSKRFSLWDKLFGTYYKTKYND